MSRRCAKMEQLLLLPSSAIKETVAKKSEELKNWFSNLGK